MDRPNHGLTLAAKIGVLDEGFWQGERGLFQQTIVAYRGLYAYWHSNKSRYSTTFNEVIESVVVEEMISEGNNGDNN